MAAASVRVNVRAGILTWRLGRILARAGWTHAAVVVIVLSSVLQVAGQGTNEVEELKGQLRQLQENFERMQREQRQQIEALTKKLDDLTKQQAAEAERKKLEQELAKELQRPRGRTRPRLPLPPRPPCGPLPRAGRRRSR